MADIFDWTGAPGARFDDPASWFDVTLDTPAERAPGPGDTAVFQAGDWSATGGGQVGTLLIEDGASVTLDGTGSLSTETVTEGSGSALLLQGVTLSVNQALTIGRDSVLDLSEAGASTLLFPPFGEVSVSAFTLALAGPGDGAAGGHVLLGDNTLQLLILNNGNSGSGNDFDPGLGIGGTGRVILGTIDVPNVKIYDPDQGSFTGAPALDSLDFGTLHVGDAGHLRYALTNLSGNAGWPSFGAIQTLAHGGNVTDPALSGSGVTPQDFGIGPRGGTATFEVTLDTAAALLLQDQAVHVGFEFQGFQFDIGTTLPITGAVLNYAEPGFELASGPGALAGEGTHWTLDLGSLAQGSDPGTALLAIRNLAAMPADDLGGSFDVSGEGIAVAGADPFAGLAAGDALAALSLRFDTTTPGAHAGTITLHPTSGNASGFLGDLPAVTLTVTDLVVAAEGGGGTDGHHPPGHHDGMHHPEHHHRDHRPEGHGHPPAHQHGAWAA